MSRATVEGTVPVLGRDIWYRIDGADTGGIPLLVIHGGPGLSHDYLLPLVRLADTRPVILYDQFGCGRSERPLAPYPYSLEDYVEELTLIREALCPGPVHILGQSWGTMLATEYLLTRKPSGIVSLVFSGPCLSASRWEADQIQYRELLPPLLRDAFIRHEAGGSYDSPEYLEAVDVFYHRHVCRLDPWPDCLSRSIEQLSQEIYTRMWGPSECTITGTLRRYDRSRDLCMLSVPALFTCGEWDEAAPATCRYYQQLLPGSELVVFPGASHSHHLEQEDEYLQVVRSFLEQAEGRMR